MLPLCRTIDDCRLPYNGINGHKRPLKAQIGAIAGRRGSVQALRPDRPEIGPARLPRMTRVEVIDQNGCIEDPVRVHSFPRFGRMTLEGYRIL